MSMIHCDECGRLIDSDFDCECFIETSPTTTVTLCEHCRELDDDGDSQFGGGA